VKEEKRLRKTRNAGAENGAANYLFAFVVIPGLVCFPYSGVDLATTCVECKQENT